MSRNYEPLTPREIELIDRVIEASILKRKLHSEKELMQVLRRR